MHNPRTEREGQQTRNARRLGTKSPRIKAAQNATKGTLRRAQRQHTGTGKLTGRVTGRNPVTVAPLALFNVRNGSTKREVQIRATDSDNAIALALESPYRLAKSAAKLTATPA